MSIVASLSALAWRRCRMAAVEAVGAGVAAVGPAEYGLEPTAAPQHEHALYQANERAWLALEVALAGEPLWERMKVSLGGDVDGDFPRHIRSFLDALPLAELGETERELRRLAWTELRAARKSGLLTTGSLQDLDLTHGANGFPCADHQESLPTDATDLPAQQAIPFQEEWETLGQLAETLDQAGYHNLSSILALRSEQHSPLLADAVCFYFRQALAAVPDLSDRLDSTPPESTPAKEEQAFAELLPVLIDHREWLEALLSDYADHPRASAPPPAAEDDNPAEFEFQRGLEHFHQGDYDRAAAAFTAALRFDPTRAPAFAYRGDAHRLRGDYDRALADFAQALQLDASQVRVYLNRGLVHRLLGDQDAALADFSQAILLDPKNAQAFNNRGQAFADLGEHDQAIADFSAAVAIDPGFFWAYHNRGRALALKGDYRSAAADYTQALSLNSSHPLIYNHRGDAFRLQGEYERAAADYTAALRLQPQNVAAFVNRGDVYRLQGDLELAVADYTEALKLDPENAEVLCQRGIIRRLLTEFKASLDDLNQAIRLNPGNALAYYNRGKIFAILGDDDKASADFTDAIYLRTNFALAYLDRALCNERRSRFREAIFDCTNALALDSGLAAAYFIRGKAYAGRKNVDRAVADFTQAIHLDPQFPLTYLERGLVHVQQGQHEAALADFSRVLQLEPRNALAYAHRAMLFQRTGDRKRAWNDLGRAFRLDADAVLGCWTRGLTAGARDTYAGVIADYAEGIRPDPQEADEPQTEEEPPEPARKSPARPAPQSRNGSPLPQEAEVPPARPKTLAQVGKETMHDLAGEDTPAPAKSVADDGDEEAPLAQMIEAEDPVETPAIAAEQPAAAESVPPEDGLTTLDDNDDQYSFAVGSEPELAAKPSKPATKVVVSEPTEKIQKRDKTSPQPSATAAAAPKTRPSPAAKTQAHAKAKPTLQQPALKATREQPRAKEPETSLVDSLRSEIDSLARTAPEPIHTRCLTCGNEFTAYEFEGDGRVRCYKCKAAFVPKPYKPTAPVTYKSKKDLADEAEDRADRRKVWLIRAGIAAGVALLLYFGWGIFGPAPKVSDLTAERVYADYAKDPVAADKKYANKPWVLTGKVASAKQENRLFPEVFFEPPGGVDNLRIVCRFTEEEDCQNVKDGVVYKIRGRILPKQGDKIALESATALGSIGGSPDSARHQDSPSALCAHDGLSPSAARGSAAVVSPSLSRNFTQFTYASVILGKLF